MATKRGPVDLSSGKFVFEEVATKVSLAALKDAFEEIGKKLVNDAVARCPVRQVFQERPGPKPTKKMAGKFAYLQEEFSPSGRRIGIGRGAHILIHKQDRLPANMRHGTTGNWHGKSRNDLVVGHVEHQGRNKKVDNWVRATPIESVNDAGVWTSTGDWDSSSGWKKESRKGLSERRVFIQGIGHEVQTNIGRTANRSGTGTRIRYKRGYALNGVANDRLTSRARYNLARGIGVHKVGRHGSYSDAPAGSIIIGGALRDSIRYDVIPIENGYKLVLRAGNEKVDYAEYVEYGTWKDPAQPFMRPAMKAAKGYAGGILQSHLSAVGVDAHAR